MLLKETESLISDLFTWTNIFSIREITPLNSYLFHLIMNYSPEFNIHTVSAECLGSLDCGMLQNALAM